jgi:hypothetical protein
LPTTPDAGSCPPCAGLRARDETASSVALQNA